MMTDPLRQVLHVEVEKEADYSFLTMMFTDDDADDALCARCLE
jgi:hypothetical protein